MCRARRVLVGAVLVLTSHAAAAAASDHVTQAIRVGLPGYDPHVREAAAVTTETKPVTPAAEAAAPAPAAPRDPAVVLPRLVVRPTSQSSAPKILKLPHVTAKPAPGKDVPADPFMTSAAKDAALVKKHLTAFDRQVLNRFTLPLFGVTKEQRAREAEAIEQSARALGAIADLAELSSLEGADPAEQKKLKELYLDAYVGRAK